MKTRSKCPPWLLSVLLLAAATPLLAQEIGTVTLQKDTSLRLIRGVSVWRAAEGVRLRAGDVVETGENAATQAQLELVSGSVVELGPATQVYLLSQTKAGGKIVLITGWLKGETSSGSDRYITSRLSVETSSGSVLLHADDRTTEAFVEKGSAVIAGSGGTVRSSKDNLFFTTRAGAAGTSSGRPSADFTKAMPFSFRDVLPSRLARFAGKTPPDPEMDHEVSFAEVEPLLTLPFSLRTGLVARFRARLQDHTFRKAVETHIGALSDWRSAVYPEKYPSGAAPKI